MDSDKRREMSKLLLLTLLFTLSACGSHLVINPQGCKDGGFWGNKNTRPQALVTEEYDFEINETYWTPIGFLKPTEVFVKELFDEYDIDCSKVVAYRVDIKATWFDAFMRFIPFMSRKSVSLKGVYVPESFKEEE